LPVSDFESWSSGIVFFDGGERRAAICSDGGAPRLQWENRVELASIGAWRLPRAGGSCARQPFSAEGGRISAEGGRMRVFLTGATGYIGSAVLDTLVRAGHEVTALVRDAAKANRVAERGAHPAVADLSNPASYEDVAQGHQACVHTALDSSPRGPDIDRLAIETLTSCARRATGRGKSDPRVFIYTSGVWVLGAAGEPVAEDAVLEPATYSAWRAPHEQLVLKAAGGNLRTVVVRPGIVYGGARGIVSDLFKDAVNGLVRVIGPGENRWALVYDRDLADLYARLVVHPEASGIYHATDEGDERVNEIVEAIGSHVNVRPDVRHIPLEEARIKQGPYAAAVAMDQVVRGPRARAIGWTPSLRSVSGNVPRLLEQWRAGQSRM
jgi:nucleoside-diphosphate-sugar epimerase